ncbi:MAG: dolichyl-phosphate beta-D-mannosyltransferase, partial [Candidatus Marinimicrobia bacterium]|nr:dolichyl-phosphate beta-D-mannosyltransferase [Candidatus Neomarinimicrobiota bacterium]
MKFLVIIPTYNENANISTVLNKVLNLKSESQIDILVIDDSSPDGTANTVKEIMNTNSNVNLLQREGKLGLSSAYCTGFLWAIDKDYDYVIQMDADLSHNPNDILKFIDKSRDFDIIIGSRYKTGVNVVNWPLRRLV